MIIAVWVVVGFVLLFGCVVFFGAPYVPSLSKQVKLAFDKLYPVKNGDVVADLGAGDGGVLRAATQRGARGYGVELNPLLVLIARLRVGCSGHIEYGNMWRYALPQDVTLVYVFAVSRDATKLERYLQKQASRLNRPLAVMTFGAKLPTLQPTATLNAHTLYQIKPLQVKKA